MTSILTILRETNRYTQEYVGRILGIKQNTYSKLENGRIRLTTDRITKLADLYGVDPEILVCKELPIVNFNNGAFSKGIINPEKNIKQCSNIEGEMALVLKDIIIAEKDKQIFILKEQLEEKRSEIFFLRDLALKQK